MRRYIQPRRPAAPVYGNYPQPWTMSPQSAPPQKSKKPLIAIILVAGLLLLIGILIFALTRSPSAPESPEKLMDLKIKNIDSQVKQGDELNYQIEALNLGTAQIYDIILRYDIYTINGQWFPELRVEETVALKDKSTFNKKLNINLSEGTYKLKVAVNYGGETGVTSQNFEVIGADEEVDVPTTEQPTQEETTTTTQTPQENPTANIEKLSGKTDAEFEKEALASSGNPTRAIQLCISISSEYNSDFCLNELAEKSGNSLYCTSITEENKRNICYMALALEGQPELCDRITDGYKKNTCLALI